MDECENANQKLQQTWYRGSSMCFETKRLPLRCQRNIFGRKRGNSEYVEEMEQDIDDTVVPAISSLIDYNISQENSDLKKKIDYFFAPYNKELNCTQSMSFNEKATNCKNFKDVARKDWKIISNFILKSTRRDFRGRLKEINEDLYDNLKDMVRNIISQKPSNTELKISELNKNSKIIKHRGIRKLSSRKARRQESLNSFQNASIKEISFILNEKSFDGSNSITQTDNIIKPKLSQPIIEGLSLFNNEDEISVISPLVKIFRNLKDEQVKEENKKIHNMNKLKLKISKLNSFSQITNQTYYKTPLFNSNHNDFSKNCFESTKILMSKDSEPKFKIEDIESENRIGRKSLLRKRNLSCCDVQTYVQNQSFSDTILDKIMLPKFTTPSKFKPKQNSKNNLDKCGYRSSSSVVSNLIQNNSSSTVLNYINAVSTKENSVDNIKLNKLETISRNSSVSSTRNSSKSNLKLSTTQKLGSIYSKRKCEELFHALNDIGHNLYDSFSLPPFQQKCNKDSTSSKQNLEQKADNVISVLEKKNKVNINKAIIFQSKAKEKNAELNNIQRIRFGRRSNHTDFKVMQFL